MYDFEISHFPKWGEGTPLSLKTEDLILTATCQKNSWDRGWVRRQGYHWTPPSEVVQYENVRQELAEKTVHRARIWGCCATDAIWEFTENVVKGLVLSSIDLASNQPISSSWGPEFRVFFPRESLW